MNDIFLQLAVIIGIAVLVSFLMKLLRQPLIIGYILTGVIVGPSLFSLIGPDASLQLFGRIGVALLLFIVGIGLNPQMIKDVGRVSVVTGIGQVVFTTILGFGIGWGIGLDPISSLYLAVAFTFSSTIVILRLLFDKEEEDSLYGRIAIGILLVQDLIAMCIFVFLSSFGGTAELGWFVAFSWVILKLVLVGLTLFFLWRYLIPQVDRFIASNTQVLFLFSLALCFSVASIFQFLGFSLELGALVAGVLLSTSPYHREMAARIQPLRDFFLVIFFIFIGTNVVIASVLQYLWPILIFSIFILIGNPLVVFYLLLGYGHTRRTAFLAGLTVAQISEFSLIMIGIGITLGHIPEQLLALATTVGIITITVSSYMITYNEWLYERMKGILTFLSPFASDHDPIDEYVVASPDLVIFGGHRTVGGIIEALTKQKKKYPYLVVDHDPGLVERLRSEHVPVLFGDAQDASFLDELDLSKTKLMISTIPDLEVNSFLLQYIKQRNPETQMICLANHRHHAQRLYEEGATYVVMPFYLGRQFMAELFKKNLFSEKKYASDRKRHLIDLKYLKHAH